MEFVASSERIKLQNLNLSYTNKRNYNIWGGNIYGPRLFSLTVQKVGGGWLQIFSVYRPFFPYYRWINSELFSACLECVPIWYGGCACESTFCPWQPMPISLVVNFLLCRDGREAAAMVHIWDFLAACTPAHALLSSYWWTPCPHSKEYWLHPALRDFLHFLESSRKKWHTLWSWLTTVNGKETERP